MDKRQLILARPVGDRSWPHVLNAIFHQLMPEESGSEISKLTLSVRLLMSMPVEEVHRELTDAGIPYLDTESGSGQIDDLTSSSLGDMGSATDQGYQPEIKPDTVATETPKGEERTPDRAGTSQPTGEQKTSPKDEQSPPQVQRSTGATDALDKDRVAAERSNGHGKGSSIGDSRAKKPRPKHKEQWDRRLLSYVRKKQEESPDAEKEGPSEHNLAVEVVARAAVCAYEKARGRVAEQVTGEDRFIEVKGVNGEWNQTGAEKFEMSSLVATPSY